MESDDPASPTFDRNVRTSSDGSVLVLLAAVAVIVIFVLLGNWQLGRADDKRALAQAFDAGMHAPARSFAAGDPAPPWHAVRLEGVWLAEASVYLDNRVQEGRVGYHVLTPLKLSDGSGLILVNRGWVAAGAYRDRLPDVAVTGGSVTVEGFVRLPEVRPFTLAESAGQGRLWQYVDLAAYRAWSGLAVGEWMVQQTSGPDDGLVRVLMRPADGVERHLGYAFQWYALSGLAFVLVLGALLRRRSNRAG